MFERVIWDKLPECIFESFEKKKKKRWQFQNFQKSRGKRDDLIITPNQQTRCVETNIF